MPKKNLRKGVSAVFKLGIYTKNSRRSITSGKPSNILIIKTVIKTGVFQFYLHYFLCSAQKTETKLIIIS